MTEDYQGSRHNNVVSDGRCRTLEILRRWTFLSVISISICNVDKLYEIREYILLSIVCLLCHVNLGRSLLMSSVSCAYCSILCEFLTSTYCVSS